MLGSVTFLRDRQRALVERFGVGVATLGVVQQGEVVEEGRRGGIFGTKLPLAEFKNLPPERYGLLILADRIECPALAIRLV